jgi:outer membrane cobalamin receptor
MHLLKLLLSCGLCPLQANEPAQPLEIIVVTGSADSREMLELSPKDSPWSTESIRLNLEEIQNLSLKDLLERQSSIQLKTTGGRASFATLSIRGSSSAQVKVFIDGQELNNGQQAQVDLSKLPLQQFERIEIYRSHAPAKFGVSPMGGVINLITRRHSEHLGDLKLGVGSFDFYEAFVNLNLKTKKTSHLLQFEHQQEEGDFDYVDDNQTPDNSSDDVNKTRTNNDFKSFRGLWSGKYVNTKESQWDWKASLYQRDKGLPGPAKFQTQAVRYEELQQQLAVGFHQPDLIFKNGFSHINLAWLNENDDYRDPQAELGNGNTPQHNEYLSNTWDLGWLQQQSFALGVSTFNLHTRLENFESKDRQLQQTFPKSSRQQTDLGVENTLPFGHNKFEFTAGWTGSQVQNKLKLEGTPNNVPTNGTDWYNTWNTGLLWHLLQNLDFRTGYSKSLRLPTLGELYGDRGITKGNDTLEAESANNYDLGFHWRPEAKGPFHQNDLSLNYFVHQRDRLIALVFYANGVSRAENLGDGQVEGVELATSSKIGDHFTVSQSLTWMDAVIKNPLLASGAGKKIPGIAEWSWAPKMSVNWGDFEVYYDILLEQNMFYDNANFFSAADKELHHIGCQWNHQPFNIAFDIHNLTDQQVEDFNNWPRPGRTFSLSFLTSF